jgi:hypothetical protein
MYELGLAAHQTITGLPSLGLLPDAPVPDGRTVLLNSPATTGSRSVGAGGIHGLSYQLPTPSSR